MDNSLNNFISLIDKNISTNLYDIFKSLFANSNKEAFLMLYKELSLENKNKLLKEQKEFLLPLIICMEKLNEKEFNEIFFPNLENEFFTDDHKNELYKQYNNEKLQDFLEKKHPPKNKVELLEKLHSFYFCNKNMYDMLLSKYKKELEKINEIDLKDKNKSTVLTTLFNILSVIRNKESLEQAIGFANDIGYKFTSTKETFQDNYKIRIYGEKLTEEEFIFLDIWKKSFPNILKYDLLKNTTTMLNTPLMDLNICLKKDPERGLLFWKIIEEKINSLNTSKENNGDVFSLLMNPYITKDLGCLSLSKQGVIELQEQIINARKYCLEKIIPEKISTISHKRKI